MMLPLSALAEDSFLNDFNLYAESIYGIDKISPVFTGTPKTYSSETVEIMVNGQETTLMAERANTMDVITAACCTLRIIDNTGNRIDQYGMLMHAYFLACSGDGEKQATTESGTNIFVSVDPGFVTIRLVR
jgi:hypothetical protein